MSRFLIDGRPTLTCMIQAKTPERIFELIKIGLEGEADAFGIQFEQLERQYHTKENYTAFFAAMNGKPCYATNYNHTANEKLTDDEIVAELIEMAECGAALIDIMGDTYCRDTDQITYNKAAINKQKALIKKIHSLGAEVLISTHTYRFMPYEDVYKILKAQKERNADIAKLVTAADNEEQLKTNLEISAKLSKALGIPYLFLCLGSHCSMHRRIAPFISNNGLFLCVAEYDELATPAQPLLADAKKIVDLIK